MSPKVVTPTVEETLAFLAARIRHLESLEHGIEPFSAHPDNPACRVYRSTDQSIPNTTWTPISFDNERFDTDNIWVIGSPTRLTCQTAGKYQISASLEWKTNATGYRMIGIRLNATWIDMTNQAAISWDRIKMSISTLYELSVGGFVEILGFQSSGAALDVAASANYSPEFMMARVG